MKKQTEASGRTPEGKEEKLSVNDIPAGNAASDLDPTGKANTSIQNTTDHSGKNLDNFKVDKEPINRPKKG